MRPVRHLDLVEPVVAVRAHDHGIVMVDLHEELARRRRVGANAGAKRGVHVGVDGQEIAVLQVRHVFRHGLLSPGRVLRRVPDRRVGRLAGVAGFLRRER
jgi:hypothetical protein